MDIEKLIEGAHHFKASDIHIMEEKPPFFRVDGTIIPTKEAAVTHEDMLKALDVILPERLKQELDENRNADFSYQHKDMVRLRVSGFYENRKLSIVMRLIPMHIPTMEELDIDPNLKQLGQFHFGMGLVTGPTGSGKTNTLAAIIKDVNTNQKKSIITVEDPIEFTHMSDKSIVRQREVGEDVLSFNLGLKAALRQDPDIILVGEMRDLDTISIAIKAAETGHLVFSTLHTTTAVQTIDRIISVFPETQQEIVREQLATNLRAIVTQALVKRKGGGRCAVQEILISNPTIKKLILESRTDAIVSMMKTGENGMQVFDQALANLVRAKKVTQDEGMKHAKDEFAFIRYVKGVSVSSDAGGVLAGM